VKNVDVLEQGGNTTVTIEGSSRPSFTAFKLTSPQRLVIDIASSELRGVPSLLDKSTKLVGGVATSQYSSGGGPVCRIVINLRQDAGYRIRTVGSNLVATIHGGHAAEEENDTGEKALRGELERIRAEAEAARKMHDEARAELLQLKAKSEQRAAEASAARLEAQAAVDALAKARSRDVERDEGAREASKKLEAAQRDLVRIKTQLGQAESALKKEQEDRTQRNKIIAALEARLVEAQNAATRAAQERSEALAKVSQLEKAVDDKERSAKLARTELESALLAQREAAQKYEQSAQQEKAKQRVVLEDAQGRALEAQRKLKSAETALVNTRQELVGATRQVKVSTRKAELAVDERSRIEIRTASELEKARAAQTRAEQAALAAEAEAQKARLSKQEAEGLLKQERAALEQARKEATKAADEKVKLALAKAAQSEQARRQAAGSLEASRSRLAGLEGEMSRMKAEAEAAIARATQSADSRVSAAVSELANTRTQLEEAQKKAQQADREAEATLGRLSEAEKRARRAEDALEAARKELGAKDAAVARLTAETQSARNQAQAEAQKAAQAQELARRTQQELAMLRSRAEQAESIIARVEQEKAAQVARADQAERKAQLAEQEKAAEAARAEEAERRARRSQQAETKLARVEQEKAAQVARAEQAELKAQLAEREKAAEAARAEEAERRARQSQQATPVAATAAIPTVTPAATPVAQPAPSTNRKMTQEELRQARLAQMSRQKSSQQDDPPAPAEKSQAQKAKTTIVAPTVRDIEFKVEDAGQTVVVRTDAVVEYTSEGDGRRSATLLLRGAKLLPSLERTLDVTDFAGVVESVSSYSVDGGVRLDVRLAKAARGKLERQGNDLRWFFAVEHSSKVAPTENLRRQGTKTIEVSREDPALYSYPEERTAAASGQLSGSEKKKRYTGRHVDLDFKDADIHNILRLLADVGRVNIVTADDVRGSVTIRMRDVAWDHALDVILTAKGLGMVREGNLIRVAPQEVLDKEREMELARRKAQVALEPISTRIIPNSFSKANEIEPRARDLLSERGKISVDTRTNVLIVQDTADVIDRIERLVRALDTQTPQVLIEARIVEASSTYAREIGIQWGGDFTASAATANPTGLAFPSSIGVAGGAMDQQTPLAGLSTLPGGTANPNFGVNLPAAVGTGSGGALGITLGSITNNANLSLRLSAMEESGTLRILSSPKILTLDNTEARIETGTLIPYSQISAQGIQTAFKEAKLALQVTPHSTAEGSVLLDLKVTRDEPDFNNKGARGDPTILKREAETQLLVNDGHTAVIGGIYTRSHGTSYKKVPFFADIPVLGWLFKSRTDTDRRTEMLIFITPRIVNRAESIGG
jgi:type IV pilus assembly protein PilQ